MAKLSPSYGTLIRPHVNKNLQSFRVYRWAISFLINYRLPFILFIACGVIISFAELAIPKFLQVVVDEVVPNRNVRLLASMFSAIAGLIAVMIVLTAARNLLQRIFSMKASKDLQYALFRHLRRLGFSYYEQNPAGRTLSLLNTEVEAVQQLYRWYFPDMMQRILMLILFGTIMLATNLKLSLITIPCFISYYVISPYFQHLASKYISETKSYRLHYNKKIYDSVSSVTELRAHSAEEWDMSKLMAATRRIIRYIVIYKFNSHFCESLRGLTTYLGILLIFWFGAKDVQAGLLSIGEFVAFVLYYLLFMHAVTQLVTVILDQRIAVAQAKELYAFLKTKPDVIEPEGPQTLSTVKGSIEFRQVSFGYGDQPDVLKKFHLQVKPGERIALVGTSGNGKSTVLKLIGRFYDPREGEVLLDGISLKNLSFEQLRNSIGFVFQDTYLFGTTVKENIKFGNPFATDEQVYAAAKAANAHCFIMQFSHGYDSLVGERGIKLSGGQRQRIAIARMFLKNPSVVLLDEATSALDNVSEKEVQHALDQLLVGRTTIAVAHRLSTVKDYDRIIYIEDGRVAEIGSYQQLMRKGGLFYRLVVSHTEEEQGGNT